MSPHVLTQTVTGPNELLTEARADLASRPWFANAPEPEQDAAVRQEARRLALLRWSIGQRAGAVDRAIANLIDAAKEFVEHYPNRTTAAAACAAAIRGAGLEPPRTDLRTVERYGYDADHYANVPEELQLWLPLLDVAWERLAAFGVDDSQLEDGSDAQGE
jgi:hypothetical protein